MAEKSLEERFERLEHEVERLRAYVEIQNLMSRYEYWHSVGLDTEIAKNFAEKTPGASAEIAYWGLYEGSEGARKLYAQVHGTLGHMGTGALYIHTLTTPVIEVAGDGKTAKAVWISPGVETPVVEGKHQALWCWVKYGVDFVKEDGKWKFWRTHVYRVFRCPYEKSWVEMPDITEPAPLPLPDELKPDKPTTYDWVYSPTLKTENVPAPPEPYETWDGKSMA